MAAERAHHDETIDSLVSFIHQAAEIALQYNDDELTDTIHTIIDERQEATKCAEQSKLGPYTHVPTKDHQDQLVRLMDAESKVRSFKEHMSEQLETIKAQNIELDRRASDMASKTEENHELASEVDYLRDQLQSLQKANDIYKPFEQKYKQVHKRLTRLTGDVESLREKHKVEKAEFEKKIKAQEMELKSKDNEIERRETELKTLMLAGHQTRLGKPAFVTDKDIRKGEQSIDPSDGSSLRPQTYPLYAYCYS